MDPITALAAIIQLIGLYRQERGDRADESSNDFMRWLETHRHNEIKDLISETFHLQEQVNTLLRNDHAKILDQIESLSEITLSIARRFDGIAPIVDASPPEKRLPDQALGLLQFTHKNEGHGFELIRMTVGLVPVMLPGGIVGRIDEPQFLVEDCDLLAALGFVRLKHSTSGNARYMITRAGADFAESLPELPDDEE